MSADERVARRVSDLTLHLLKIEGTTRALVQEVSELKSQHSGHAHSAEWHVLGALYHCRNLRDRYEVVSQGIQARLSAGPEVLVMYAPEFQELLFEFYALVSLCKILLDQLRNYLAPVFTTRHGNLPKSVRDFTKGDTDCPVYQRLASHPAFSYLLDIRTCIVHFRTLAVGSNLFVSEEGVNVDDVLGLEFMQARIPSRALYRRTPNGEYVVNIYLPDRVFRIEEDGNKRLTDFTYDMRINLLTESVRFVSLSAEAVCESLSLLRDTEKPTFSYTKRTR